MTSCCCFSRIYAEIGELEQLSFASNLTRHAMNWKHLDNLKYETVACLWFKQYVEPSAGDWLYLDTGDNGSNYSHKASHTPRLECH